MAELKDYGAGQSGAVLIEQIGPVAPDPEHLRIAKTVALGRADSGFPIPCMDCVPNIVLKDYLCEDGCGGWHWGMLVAHDDSCPSDNGLTAPPR